MSVDKETFRRDLLGMLDDIAAGGLGRTGWHAYFDELMCMWFDDHWHRPEELVRDGILSDQEYRILEEFARVLRESGDTIDEHDLNRLKGDPRWQRIVESAKWAQGALQNCPKPAEQGKPE